MIELLKKIQLDFQIMKGKEDIRDLIYYKVQSKYDGITQDIEIMFYFEWIPIKGFVDIYHINL